ncbi:gastrula zinc finger protein XlCGF57.1-like isoform X2 [Cylas formicarius]|uniref:gastrula zinc finger protein XlCGF57.1-like isoform X2 n=1 Tax=Cylas formicarius TaxID=197179 RepID=UPI0029583DCE|nr:gastrula zinc finger protein XlCGF57.1-like isoform X2 [Cylas formicarius]
MTATQMLAFSIPPCSVDSICRVCLMEQSEMISIYEVNLLDNFKSTSSNPGKTDLVSIFGKYCNIKVETNDQKPQQICAPCLSAICNSYNIFETFKQSDQILSKALNWTKANGTLKVKLEFRNDVGACDEIKDLENTCFNEKIQVSKPEASRDLQKVTERVLNRTEKKEQPKIEKVFKKKKRERPKMLYKNGEAMVCKFCNGKFVNVHKLIEHYFENHREKRSCPICSKSLDGERLKYHMSIHAASHYSCRKCYTYFNSEVKLNEHIQQFDHSMPFTCPLCSKTFNSKKSRNKHVKNHSLTEKYHCPKCGEEFKHDTSYVRHMRIHEIGKEFLCSVCGKGYSTKHALECHMENGHTNRVGMCGKKINVYCEFCHETVKSGTEYLDHRQTHQETEVYTCGLCEQSFPTKTNFSIHLPSHHIYICESCGRIYDQQTSLDLHRSGHLIKLPDQNQCKVCKITLTTKLGLRRHMRIHSNARPYLCQICGKAFKQIANLTAHSYTHNKERPFECSWCHKRFIYQSNLTSHIRIHTGEKPFQCPYCVRRYRDSTLLHKHKKRKHPEKLEPTVAEAKGAKDDPNVSDSALS